MNPFLALRTLSADVEHAVGQGTEVEDGFGDAGGSEPGPEEILITRQIVGREETLDVKQKTARVQFQPATRGRGVKGGLTRSGYRARRTRCP